MKVIFAGTPQNAAQTLEALVSAGVEVVAVLTRTDAFIGRKKILTPSPVATTAENLGIPTLKYNQLDDEALAQVDSYSADVGVVVAYGAFLSPQALGILPKGWINLHYSLLPKLRGAAPVQHAILNGEETTGVTIFKIDEGMDSGPILTKLPTKIEIGENAGQLLNRLTLLGISALLELLPGIAAGFVKEQDQDHTLKSFAPKISRNSARLDWNEEASKVENLVNGMNPEPMAWTSVNGSEIRVLTARTVRLDSQGNSTPGTTTMIDGAVATVCGDGNLVELQTVQPAGKSAMNAADWFRGQESKGPIVFE